MSTLYRIDIVESREDVRDELWTIRYSWAIGEPTPYHGDWEPGIYESAPTLTEESRTHVVIAEEAKATALRFVQRHQDLTQRAMNTMAANLRATTA